MRLRGIALAVCLLVLVSAACFAAEQVTEVWRSLPLTSPSAVSVNPTDGSCRVADLGQWEVQSPG